MDQPAFSTDDADKIRRLRRLVMIARVMDSAVKVPGTGIRLGADSLIGLIPGIGDMGGALIGLAIVNEARRLGLPANTLARMLANVGLDTAVGVVPLLGDLFDIYFKAHRRNVRLVLEHFEQNHPHLVHSAR